MVKQDDFVSLHMHSEFSILDGFSKVEEYVQAAEQLGQRALGLTDHGNLLGAYSLVKEAKKHDLLPIVGCEFYVAPVNPDGARVRKGVFYGSSDGKTPYDVAARGAYLHLTVWAQNEEGLRNLFKLSTLSNKPEHFFRQPRIDFEMLAAHSDGLIVATGCPSSEVSTRLLLGQDKQAYDYASQLKEVFGERLFIEVMDHSMSSDIERILLPKQMEMSKDLGIPLLVTNDCHYAHKHDAKAHEEMLCSQSGAVMSDEVYDKGGKRFAFDGDQYYMKTGSQMRELFPDDMYPDAVKNTMLVAEMVSEVSLDFDASLRPLLNIPDEFRSEADYYKFLLSEGFKEKYGDAPDSVRREAMERVKKEMNTIYSSDFIGYMLTVRDYTRHSKDAYSVRDSDGTIVASSMGVGRGSAGGSVHSYLLDITDICPVEHDLLSERFLSDGRGATYQLSYDDGSVEKIVVSDVKKVMSDDGLLDEKYIHELEIGDTVVVDEG